MTAVVSFSCLRHPFPSVRPKIFGPVLNFYTARILHYIAEGGGGGGDGDGGGWGRDHQTEDACSAAAASSRALNFLKLLNNDQSILFHNLGRMAKKSGGN
jgi:hypothetical protein